jgi:cystathionine beta-lyase/cystathionine gamma-synthase
MTGYSGLMGFIPKCERDQVLGLIKRLRLFEEGPSWGGFESLINSPGLWLDEEGAKRHGIPYGLLRISVGLEDAESLMADLDQSLQQLHK